MATEYIKNGIAVNGLDLIASSLKEHPELLLIYERQIRAAFDTINYTSYPYSIFSKLPEAISDINYDSINIFCAIFCAFGSFVDNFQL